AGRHDHRQRADRHRADGPEPGAAVRRPRRREVPRRRGPPDRRPARTEARMNATDQAVAGSRVVAAAAPRIRSRIATVSIAAFAVALSSIVLAPLVGSTRINLAHALDWSIPWAANVDAQIFFVALLPPVLPAALVGAALASSGVVFQALLRNPLATPFTLGVSPGAALAAMLATPVGGAVTALAWAAVPAASFLGALAAVAVVYFMAAARHRGFFTGRLVLTGVTRNSFLSALILLVQYFADMTQTMQTLRWLLGDLDVAGYRPLVAALPMLAIAYVVFLVLAPSLNLLSLGTDLAAARGVDVVRVERVAFLTAS